MHKTTREGDEYACSCGLRWDIGEDDPHNTPCTACGHTLAEGEECFGDYCIIAAHDDSRGGD